jgi:hypothetical protein
LGLSLSGGAQAGALGAEGIRAALDQLPIVEPVHCLPGRVHRRSPPYDGCYRTSRRYYAPRPYAYAPAPYPYYGYRQHYYGGPVVSFGFSTGRRHGGYGFGWGW